MYPVGGAESFFALVFIWLGILSYVIWKEKEFLRKLFPKNQGDIKDKLKEVLEAIEEAQRQNKILNRNIRQVALDGLVHIQKVAVLRYNPYEDTGGSISFSIAMLDGLDSGFILSSLHTRVGTRIYTKIVKAGECEHKLSKEEALVLKTAREKIYDGSTK